MQAVFKGGRVPSSKAEVKGLVKDKILATLGGKLGTPVAFKLPGIHAKDERVFLYTLLCQISGLGEVPAEALMLLTKAAVRGVPSGLLSDEDGYVDEPGGDPHPIRQCTSRWVRAAVDGVVLVVNPLAGGRYDMVRIVGFLRLSLF